MPIALAQGLAPECKTAVRRAARKTTVDYRPIEVDYRLSTIEGESQGRREVLEARPRVLLEHRPGRGHEEAR